MKKILVIEDESDIRSLIRRSLRKLEFNVEEANNGKQGVLLAESILPDLIICDILMPELNGYEVLKILRENPVTQTIPFIFLSSKNEQIDWRQGMVLGADDYLPKPFTVEQLKDAIATRFEKQEALNLKSQKQLDDLRKNIMYSLPHELRTPLNGILGLSKMMIEDYDEIEKEEALHILSSIYESGERLYRLIKNFLLYADLEMMVKDTEKAQKFCKTEFPISTRTLIKQIALDKAKKNQREADIKLKLEEVKILISEENFYKIIEEILDNAFKFSVAGTLIEVSSCKIGNSCQLSIIDRGRGMTPEQIQQLAAYQQLERQYYEQQGSGLGLAIAKRLTELHGGELSIKSIQGKQTTVEITLPANLSN